MALPYTIKIPTDDELSNYVNGVWDTGQSNYDNRNPVSINYLLSNFVATSPIATWTSSYLNLVPIQIHIHNFKRFGLIITIQLLIHTHHQ